MVKAAKLNRNQSEYIWNEIWFFHIPCLVLGFVHAHSTSSADPDSIMHCNYVCSRVWTTTWMKTNLNQSNNSISFWIFYKGRTTWPWIKQHIERRRYPENQRGLWMQLICLTSISMLSTSITAERAQHNIFTSEIQVNTKTFDSFSIKSLTIWFCVFLIFVPN